MEKIYIRELSIGDLVMNLYANKPSRVKGLRTMFQDTYEIIAISDGTQYMLIEDNKELHNFEPIPLTAEILEKNGFVREDYYYGVMDEEPCFDAYRCTIYKNGYKYDIELIDDCGEAFDLEITHIETDEAGEEKTYTQLLKCLAIQHTHQLQHALRLAGIEKKIII